MGIGAKIKEYRIKAGLTQKDLADKLFVTYQAVSRWENDEAEPSIETIKEICGILGCSTDDLFEIEKKEEEKPVEEPVKVIEKVIVQEQQIVLGICEKCGKPIFEQDDLKKHDVKVRVGSGRIHHYETKTVVLCNKCDLDRLVEERMEAEKQAKLEAEERKKRRIHSFIWPSILAAIIITIAIICFVNEKQTAGVLLLLMALPGFEWLATMILNNTFITELWMEVASWGFVRMPGIIFSFSFGGIVFLIAMKIFLFLLGLSLAIASFALATGVAMILSIFVYPHALNKNIKGIE